MASFVWWKKRICSKTCLYFSKYKSLKKDFLLVLVLILICCKGTNIKPFETTPHHPKYISAWGCTHVAYMFAPTHKFCSRCVCVSVCGESVLCVTQAEIMTMMTVVGPTGARGAEWWRMTQGWALMAHRQWVMTAHPSQCSTLHYLYGEKHSTKAGRAALSLPSNDICSWRQPHYRSSFTSLSLHLSPSMVIFLAPFLSPFSLALCHPLRGGYTEVRQWDNDSPLSTFQIRAFSFSLSSVVLSFLILSLSIFSYSLVLMRLRGWSDATEETACLVKYWLTGLKSDNTQGIHGTARLWQLS